MRCHGNRWTNRILSNEKVGFPRLQHVESAILLELILEQVAWYAFTVLAPTMKQLVKFTLELLNFILDYKLYILIDKIQKQPTIFKNCE